MKLRKEHFVKEEKPEPVLEMYYKPDHGCQKLPQECYESDLLKYEQDLKEWERKYIKPTPKWIKFSDEKPVNGHRIYLEWEDCLDETIEHFTTAFCPICLDSNNEYDDLIYTGDVWASVEEYKEDLKYFEEHQQVFEGWAWATDYMYIFKDECKIWILDDEFTISKLGHGNLYRGKNGSNAIGLLKLICEDNNIKL